MSFLIWIYLILWYSFKTHGESIEVCDENSVKEIINLEHLLQIFPNTNNILLFLYNDQCVNDINHIYFNNAQIQFGSTTSLFTLNDQKISNNIINDWNINQQNCSLIVFIPRNTNYNDVSQNIMICPSQNPTEFHKWIDFITSKQSIRIMNKHNNPINHIVCDYGETFLKQLPPNVTQTLEAEIRDILVWRDSSDNHLLSWYLVKGFENEIIQITDNNTLCDTITDKDECNTLKEEYMIKWRENEWDKMRIAKINLQKTLMPKFTQKGYIKLKISKKLHKKLKKYLISEREGKNAEIEAYAGPFFNQYEAETKMVYLNNELNTAVIMEVRDLVKRWLNKNNPGMTINIIPTAIYGIRQYHRGAIIKEHVDTCSTHILGGIINVDQNVDEDWLLRIYDHQNQPNDIVMKPRDIILYEAAKNQHSRPYPLNGEFYANAFVHFAPSGWKCPY